MKFVRACARKDSMRVGHWVCCLGGAIVKEREIFKRHPGLRSWTDVRKFWVYSGELKFF